MKGNINKWYSLPDLGKGGEGSNIFGLHPGGWTTRVVVVHIPLIIPAPIAGARAMLPNHCRVPDRASCANGRG